MQVRNHRIEEIVDDSEPERAETRRQQRKSKSLSTESKEQERKLMGRSLAQKPSCTVPINSVIEISDSDSEPYKSYERQRASNKDSPSPPLSIASSSRISNISKVEISSPTSRKQTNLSVRPAFVLFETEDNTNVAAKNTHLKRFAYTSSTTNKNPNARKDAATSTAIFTTGRSAGIPPPVRKALDLSNSDLVKVSRCVCCDIAWTTRKTAIQKMNHIQSCAKKHAFDDETILILIQNEIANHMPQTTQQAKTKQKKLSSEESISKKNTLLEDVLVDAAPRKKVRRKQAETMLANVSLTRDGILARAQDILSTSTQNVFGPAGQGVHSAEHLDGMDFDMPPSTHPFARSGLAQQQSTTSRTLFSGMTASPQRNVMCGSTSDRSLVVDEDLETDLIQVVEGKNLQPPSPSSSLENEFANLKVTSAKRTGATVKIRTPKKTHSKKAHSFDAEWERHMKKHILQNVDLHSRILRYEPVHFNEFLELAKLYAPPGSKLKSHLRSFLDNQAIHFYEGLTWKR